jgi:hypothetical protein
MLMSAFRPKSLREVVERGGVTFSVLLDEFLDEFYLAYPDLSTMQTMIAAEPALTGDYFTDAYIGATGEHLARRWNLTIPSWTAVSARSGDAKPTFVPDLATLRSILLVEAPYAFRRRNIFTGEEPLQRARWPRGVEVYEPAGLRPEMDDEMVPAIR